jgi:tellurite resistance protein TerC
MKWVEKSFPATDQYDGAKLFTHINGKKLATPMFIVIMALGTTDLLFALDSIPAIYGLTKEPYLVLTANLFALMGLRQLYFLIGGLLKKLVYLSLGLAVLLAFIGVKLVLHALHENELPFINGGEHVTAAPDIPISVSLGAIVVILGGTTVASLWKSRKDERERLSAP